MPGEQKKTVANRNIIGARLRKARKNFKPPLTQDQLSGRLASEGVQLDRVAITKIESGLRCAFDFEVRALALALKVDVKWLLGMEEKRGLPGRASYEV
jgi:HTH-type transcriptional regulator, cell division transcriptional repressor